MVRLKELENYAKFYDNFYSNGDAYQTRRSFLEGNTEKFEIIPNNINIKKSDKVLDIGGGVGVFLDLVLSKYTKHLTLCDISKNVINISNIKDKHVCNATDLIFEDNTFDYVFLLDVIEHLTKQDQEKCLEEIRRVLKDDGIFVMTTPNGFFMINIMKKLYKFIMRDSSQHIYEPSLSYLSKLFLVKNLVIYKLIGVDFPLVSFLINKNLGNKLAKRFPRYAFGLILFTKVKND